MRNYKYYFKSGISWSAMSSNSITARANGVGFAFDTSGPTLFVDKDIEYFIGLLNSNTFNYYVNFFSQTSNKGTGDFSRVPIIHEKIEIIKSFVNSLHLIAKEDWNKNEYSYDFEKNELLKHIGQDASGSLGINIEDSLELYKAYWQKKFYQLHHNEEELNARFIEIYGLQQELTPDVELKDITLLKEEVDLKKLKEISVVYDSGWILDSDKFILPNQSTQPDLPFNSSEIIKQFVSYAVGCMFGRYSLDKEGLILANQGETLEDYLTKIGTSTTLSDLSFVPDDDNIIPVLDDEWFEDDITGRFKEFLKVSFGKEHYEKNLLFVEDALGKDIRKYFIKNFYADHTKRYKKRPIYWMFSSAKGSFNVLIYMHRYTPDTLSRILNSYLREFIEKLEMQKRQMQHTETTGTTTEQNQARKQIDKIDKMLADCREYETEILYPIATKRINIDLDDGVLVNYNKFGECIAKVAGLNDAKAKKKVRGFDWIDVEEIR